MLPPVVLLLAAAASSRDLVLTFTYCIAPFGIQVHMSFAVSSSSITCTVRVVAAKRTTSDGPHTTRRSLREEGSSQGPQQSS